MFQTTNQLLMMQQKHKRTIKKYQELKMYVKPCLRLFAKSKLLVSVYSAKKKRGGSVSPNMSCLHTVASLWKYTVKLGVYQQEIDLSK